MSRQTRMSVRFWGVRGSTPTPEFDHLYFGGNTSCVEIRSPGDDVVIIDAGTGVRTLGAALTEQAGENPLNIHFLLTHFHWDHIQGLPFFSPLYSSNATVTFVSGNSPTCLQNILEGQMTSPYFPVSFDRLAAKCHFVKSDEGMLQGTGWSVRTFPMNHPQGANGYRIEREGAVIVHASDLEHGNPVMDKILREHAYGADVLIYDAQFTPEEYESKRGWGHSTWLEATRVAKDANVKRLLLCHHDPSHTDAQLNEICQNARKEFENTDMARESWTIEL